MWDRNEYYAWVSPGGVKIGRRLQDQATRRRSEQGSTTGRESRPIREFSNGSRQRMRWTINALPWTMITGKGMRLAMVTLTYPNAYPADGKQVTKHRRAFMERWRRKFGPPYGVWAREWQERGAPHFHLYVGTPVDAVVEREGFQWRWDWALEAWSGIVKSGDPGHREHGVHYRPCSFDGHEPTNSQQIADYFWRESGKRIQKQVPPGYENPGRYWNYFGPGFKPEVAEALLERREYIELRRPMRSLRDKKAQKRVQPLRGLDGLYVLTDDGRALAGKLLPWARQEATAHGPERMTRRRGSPEGSAAGSRAPDVGWATANDMGAAADEDEFMAAAIAAHEERLGALEAQIAEYEERLRAEEEEEERLPPQYVREFGLSATDTRWYQRRGGPVLDWQEYVRARGRPPPGGRKRRNQNYRNRPGQSKTVAARTFASLSRMSRYRTVVVGLAWPMTFCTSRRSKT